MPKKKPIKGKPKVNKELDGLEIKINEFGQIETSYDITNINRFLNRNVDDKKLRDRDDISSEGEFGVRDQQEEEAENEDVLFNEEDEDVDVEKLRNQDEDDLGDLEDEEEDDYEK